jgi:hypothetical protein
LAEEERDLHNAGRRLWRGQCPTIPEQIIILVAGMRGTTLA